VSIDNCLHVGGEIRVRHRRVAEILFIRLRNRDALAQLATRALLHDDHLQIFLMHPGQDGMNIAGEFGFCKAWRLRSYRFSDEKAKSRRFCSMPLANSAASTVF
jgi:hypothetical protein